MKMLVLLLVLLAAVWLWRRGRRLPPAGPAPHSGAAQPPALPMVRCQRCGMHVPGNEVVSGRAGAPYCSAAHRRESEGG